MIPINCDSPSLWPLRQLSTLPKRVAFASFSCIQAIASWRGRTYSANDVTTDQSCLNRWLVEASWDAAVLNDRRLAWLQDNPKTRYSPHGVIAIDNTLVDHSGKLIEDVGWLWDPAQQRHVIAHDYLISNYVCPSGSHYPIEWRRFRKKASCPSEEFKDHTTRCLDLIDDVLSRDIPGDFTFDSYFTHAKILNHLHAKQRHYVGALKLNRKVVFEGREQKLQEVAGQIPFADKKAVRVGKRCDWYFSKRTTIGEACRAVKGELLERLVDWIVDKLSADDWSMSQIKAVLAQT